MSNVKQGAVVFIEWEILVGVKGLFAYISTLKSDTDELANVCKYFVQIANEKNQKCRLDQDFHEANRLFKIVNTDAGKTATYIGE